MTYIVPISKDVWGSMAWHLIHNFSIHSINDECMYILIKTFGYILPCPTCKKHYNYLINDIYILEKEEISKKKIIKYLYEIHNIINTNLEKKNKISFKKATELHEKTNNNDIICFIIIVYSNFNYSNMSFNEFDKIYNFFQCFMKNYPDKVLNKKFSQILESNHFIKSDTPLTFKKWFLKYFKEDKILKKYYNNTKLKLISKID